MVPRETPGADNKGKRVRQYLQVTEEGGEVVGVRSDGVNKTTALLLVELALEEEVAPRLGPPALAAVVGPATGLVEVGLEVGERPVRSWVRREEWRRQSPSWSLSVC